jgi:hypothetical protein
MLALEDIDAAWKVRSGVVLIAPLEPSWPLAAAFGGPAWVV